MFPFYWHYTLTSSYVNPNLGSFRVAAFRTPGSVEDGNRVMLGAPAVVSESVNLAPPNQSCVLIPKEVDLSNW